MIKANCGRTLAAEEVDAGNTQKYQCLTCERASGRSSAQNRLTGLVVNSESFLAEPRCRERRVQLLGLLQLFG